jgi:hypothetical protein
MKAAFVACALLSGAILAGFCAAMRSCSTEYEIDADGRLTRDGSPREWREEMPEFARLAPQLRPGDRIRHTQTTVEIPFVPLAMTRLEVQREGEEPRIARHGAIAFWSLIAAFSLLPLIVWSFAALLRLFLLAPGKEPAGEPRPP